MTNTKSLPNLHFCTTSHTRSGECRKHRITVVDVDAHMGRGHLRYSRTRWLVHQAVSKAHLFNNGGTFDRTTVPSKDWEDKFERRWGHRTFFYAGIALSEMYPNPWSMARPLEGVGKEAVNLLAKKYGAILHKVASLKPNYPFDHEEEKRLKQLHAALYPDDERVKLRQLMRSNPKEGPRPLLSLRTMGQTRQHEEQGTQGVPRFTTR